MPNQDEPVGSDRSELPGSNASISIFRAKDAPGLDEIITQVDYREGVEEANDVWSPWLDGTAAKVLFREAGERGCSIVYVWFGPHFILPRHSHSDDCAYLVISGEVRMGNQVLLPGDGFFVPSNAPYSYRAGPEGVEVIEFRPSHGERVEMFVLEDDESRWQHLNENAEAHREAWRSTTPPLFASGKVSADTVRR